MTRGKHFFNTLSLAGRVRLEAEHKAKNQEGKILRFFLQHPDATYAPSSVAEYVFDENTPLTSVRRAMTSLTKSDDLIMLQLQTIGPYGKPEHHWMLHPKWIAGHQPEQSELFEEGTA